MTKPFPRTVMTCFIGQSRTGWSLPYPRHFGRIHSKTTTRLNRVIVETDHILGMQDEKIYTEAR